MAKHRNNKTAAAGFTLIELLVYVMVFSLLTVALVSMVLWAVRSATKARAVRETIDNTEYALAVLTREIQEARSVYTPTSTSTQLSLETALGLPSDEVTTFVDIFICGTGLCLKREAQDPFPITAGAVNVRQLRFSTIGTSTPSVHIDLELAYDNVQSRPEYNAAVRLQTTATVKGY
ncbi:MAG: type II secretion system protein [bacterium]|nr:type II secretion system protein [bacterium]MDZ4296643.1 type II secretion system protein [Patescibacteria group bacterium]